MGGGKARTTPGDLLRRRAAGVATVGAGGAVGAMGFGLGGGLVVVGAMGLGVVPRPRPFVFVGAAAGEGGGVASSDSSEEGVGEDFWVNKHEYSEDSYRTKFLARVGLVGFGPAAAVGCGFGFCFDSRAGVCVCAIESSLK